MFNVGTFLLASIAEICRFVKCFEGQILDNIAKKLLTYAVFVFCNNEKVGHEEKSKAS
jgi:hypothetical protein